MKHFEKHPMIAILIGILGVSLSSILVRFSQAPSAVTAAWRMLCTVLLLSPVVLGKASVRRELRQLERKTILLSLLSGLFLAAHVALWFESLQHTSVASSTTIVCTEVIWVALGFCVFLKGKLSGKAAAAIGIALVGSVLIALSDSSTGSKNLYGDILALIASVSAAAYILIGRVVRVHVSTTVYTFLVYLSCAAALLVLCAVGGESLIGYGLSAPVVGLLLAVFSTLLGLSLFSWSLKFFSPAFASAAKLCEPVVAAILAVFLFQEYPPALQ